VSGILSGHPTFLAAGAGGGAGDHGDGDAPGGAGRELAEGAGG
jgi:hypothetical protein